MQSACVTWFQNAYPSHRGRLFAVQNNSENVVRGDIRKAIGVRAGISDLILIVNRRVYFIELKMPDGRQSQDQKNFESMVNADGFDYVVIRSKEEFVRYVGSIIEMP